MDTAVFQKLSQVVGPGDWLPEPSRPLPVVPQQDLRRPPQVCAAASGVRGLWPVLCVAETMAGRCLETWVVGKALPPGQERWVLTVHV